MYTDMLLEGSNYKNNDSGYMYFKNQLEENNFSVLDNLYNKLKEIPEFTPNQQFEDKFTQLKQQEKEDVIKIIQQEDAY